MQTSYETSRLIIKILTPDFSNEVLSFYKENKIIFEPFEPAKVPNYYTLGYQRALLTYEYNSALKKKGIRFWIFEKNHPNKIIGTVCFHNIQKGILWSCQLGYKFGKDYHGQGYAKESLKRTIKIIFEDLKLHRIEAYIMPSNSSSIHLIRSLGFFYEGISFKNIKIQNKWEDHERYSLLNPLSK